MGWWSETTLGEDEYMNRQETLKEMQDLREKTLKKFSSLSLDQIASLFSYAYAESFLQAEKIASWLRLSDIEIAALAEDIERFEDEVAYHNSLTYV